MFYYFCNNENILVCHKKLEITVYSLNAVLKEADPFTMERGSERFYIVIDLCYYYFHLYIYYTFFPFIFFCR